MKFKTLLFTILALSLFIGTAFAQIDSMGIADTLTLTYTNYAPSKWVIEASLWNDEEIAAFDIPIKYTAGMAKLKVDSVTYTNTRTDYFAQKYIQIDTTGQMLHFGGLAYMGTDKPPLAPGTGAIGHVYLSVWGDKEPGEFVMDTTFFAPSNKLMLVDRNAKTIVPIVIIKEAVKKDKK
ncbi:MAG: hypothetical protein KAR42_05440 [candidate division Zixibacteria bacterium]|nr:hypothetical protein [candidate division Zixibacteria bacterium]